MDPRALHLGSQLPWARSQAWPQVLGHLLGPHGLGNQGLSGSVWGPAGCSVWCPSRARDTSPGEQVLLAACPTPAGPETQQLSRWLEDFSSHATQSGVGSGAGPPGFLMSQAWSPWGPVRMWPPPGQPGGVAADQDVVPREAWEGGSLCPAYRADSWGPGLRGWQALYWGGGFSFQISHCCLRRVPERVIWVERHPRGSTGR